MVCCLIYAIAVIYYIYHVFNYITWYIFICFFCRVTQFLTRLKSDVSLRRLYEKHSFNQTMSNFYAQDCRQIFSERIFPTCISEKFRYVCRDFSETSHQSLKKKHKSQNLCALLLKSDLVEIKAF